MTILPDLLDPLLGALRFGILPSQARRTAAEWALSGASVSALSFDDFGRATGTTSRTANAIRETATPAKSATDSIGRRLSALALILDDFAEDTADNDAAIGRRFDELRDR